MITFVQCVRRRPEITPAVFLRHWKLYGDQVARSRRPRMPFASA